MKDLVKKLNETKFLFDFIDDFEISGGYCKYVDQLLSNEEIQLEIDKVNAIMSKYRNYEYDIRISYTDKDIECVTIYVW